MEKKYYFAFPVCLSFLLLFAIDCPILKEQKPDWANAGVRGGIPEYPASIHDVTYYGAKGDGQTDDTQAILTAMNACPDRHAVIFPAGTYLIIDSLNITRPIVLRGDSPTTTRINSQHEWAAINVNSDWAGVEDMHVHTDWQWEGIQGEKIVFNQAKDSWVKNIETTGYTYYHILINGGTHCEIRDSYIHNNEEDMNIPEFSSYGVSILDGDASYHLVENNIFDWFRHNMNIEEFYGSDPKQNVFGYNFCWYTYTFTGSLFSATTTLEFHHNSVFYNLAEGNVVEQVGFQSNGHHYNTIFRNRITNGGVSAGDSNYIIGNELTEIKNPGSSMAGFGGNNIRGYYGEYIIYGNWITDTADPGLDFPIPNNSLPSSKYLTSRPDWFGDLDWPCYGSDLMPGNTRRSPAEVRYWTIKFPETNIPHIVNSGLQGDEVKLEWTFTPTYNGPVDYIICRSVDGNNYKRIGETYDTEYTDTLAEPGTYHYYIRARNHEGGKNHNGDVNGLDLGGESEPSNVILIPY